MATATCQLSEDQFLCSICLDVFTSPVSLPCGHSFCKTCIDQHWSKEAQTKCPYCKHVFKPKPELKVNIFMSEMADQFKNNYNSQNSTNTKEILCDFCTNPKQRALKSCRVCLSNFCESHLEPHQTIEHLQKHKLDDPQRELRKAEAGPSSRIGSEILQMIAERERTILQLRLLMQLNDSEAEVERAQGVQAFTAMIDCVRGDLDALVQDIDRKSQATEDQAKGYVKELEREILELKTSTRAATRDMKTFDIRKPTFEGTVARAMAQLEQKLSQQMSRVHISELKRVQRYQICVELDPEKIHPRSANQNKSADNKPVCRCVLAGQSFSAGKYYFEVDVSRKSKWALGLANGLHVEREVVLSPRNAYWVICMRNKNTTECYAGSEPSVRLELKSRPQKVGVFVDYEEGLVCFYDANQAGLLYTFSGCNFALDIHPFFSPCHNDGVKLHTKPESSCVLQ